MATTPSITPSAAPPATIPTTLPTTQGEPVLKDIHLAANPSFWPPAVGWWILLAVTLIAFAGIFVWLKAKLKKRRRQEEQRKALLEKLSLLETQLIKNPSNQAIAEINTLLRQYAVNFYPRSKISSLTGSDWLKFLDESGNTEGFTKGAGRILVEAPYQKSALENLNQDEFISVVRSWVKQLVNSKKRLPISEGKSNE